MLRAVTLLLSHGCNLSCSYCYQRRRDGPARMTWTTARSALDLVLAGPSGRRAVDFSGGEPTLEPALLRRCVEYVRAAGATGAAAECSLTTNGILLDDELVSFLADHDVRLDLSFDGVPAAQDLRDGGSFAALDGLLARIRHRHPGYFAHRVAIRMTVHRGSLGTMAASARYLIDRGVAWVSVNPSMMMDSAWDDRLEDILCEQVHQIEADSLRHLATTGSVPVGFLNHTPRSPVLRTWSPSCGAVSGSVCCVDATGDAWGCPLFARSLRPLPPLAESAAEVVFLGSVHQGGLRERLASLPDRAREHPLFSGRSRRSGSRRCRDCELAADCAICPASICGPGPSTDPREVPSFDCAFNRVTLDARGRFRAARARAGGEACPHDLAEALRDVARALRADATRESEGRSGRH